MVVAKEKKDKLNTIKKIKNIKGIQIIQEKAKFRSKIEIDYSDLSKFDGVKAYVLIRLRVLAAELDEEAVDDNNINSIARELYELSQSPTRYYNSLIREDGKDKVRQSKKIMRNKENTLNNTERAILKCKMSLILLEYVTKNTKFDKINYQELKVYVDLCYQCIYTGIEDKRIKKLELFVGYNSTLADYKIEYKEDGEKYNLSKHIVMFPYWHSLEVSDENYEFYQKEYGGFSCKSIDLLATIEGNLNEFIGENSKGNYNNLALKYIVTFEEELKRLLIDSQGLDKDGLTLKKSIEFIVNNESKGIFLENARENLSIILDLKKKAAGDYNINKKEVMELRRVLIDEGYLKDLSRKLNNQQ